MAEVIFWQLRVKRHLQLGLRPRLATLQAEALADPAHTRKCRHGLAMKGLRQLRLRIILVGRLV